MSRNKTVYIVLLVILTICFWWFENFYTPDTYSAPDGEATSATRLPDDLVPSSTTGMVVSHNHFTLSYSEPHEQAEWVAYLLKKEHLTYEDRKRPYYIEDPKVRTKSADWRNYKGSGYDRGHLCPAGDRRFSEQAYNETFYTSNISPQDRDFNAGVWNRLEMQVRRWAKKEGLLFVVTGGILEDGLEEIGEEDVDVPRFYYKIVAKGKRESIKTLAFLIEGKESSLPLQRFLVPIDEIEERTGIDFFQAFPDTMEADFESGVSTSGWEF
ncbi:DNA/RNA non-specific endonuclease [Flavobacteriaceae bacterium TP-CH-4]|uniref:Endonuclease n=1 Tax=Pelagihabitans pacificus TaxID=2696054 RepID=A0A967B3S6_9FLAO|nr:DNA/RNA non-specific endonuclease [Pelagihabitans pacificus]NHF61511.1 DNA/RNA non-specific endonuclease [Pelagihabitans pacificus]